MAIIRGRKLLCPSCKKDLEDVGMYQTVFERVNVSINPKTGVIDLSTKFLEQDGDFICGNPDCDETFQLPDKVYS